MIWSEVTRYNLEVKMGDLSNMNLVVSKDKRNKILQETKHSCRYCGGTYSKYLIYIQGDVCCRACYIITHINYGFTDEIEIYWSKMNQLQIVRDTIDFIVDKGRVPYVSEIDEDARILPISSIEYATLIAESNLPKEMENYKVFFTQKFSTVHLEMEKSFFDDDNDDDIPKPKKLYEYELTKKEKQFLQEHFSN